MNLILFEPAETLQPLACDDPRARHILDVLRRDVGGTFDAGLVDGPRGKGTLVARDEKHLTLGFQWGAAPPPADPLVVILGLPRPQTARKILQEGAALGVGALHFFRSEKGEAGYGSSKLWSSGEWKRHLVAGAEQAFDTRLPEVTYDGTLAEVLGSLPGGGTRIALDPYEAKEGLRCEMKGMGREVGGVGKGAGDGDIVSRVTLAFGPERGWSAAERDLLRREGFKLAHLGPRILRTETAVVAAVAIVKAGMGWLA